VGNGENIKIWNDPWIPSSPDKRIISPRGGAVYSKVSELIDPATGQWDAVLLHDLFGAVDVQRILQIPLHRQGFDDFIAWSATTHGRYTVRSGYYLQWQHQFGASANQLALPGSSATNPVWKIIWQMKIPSKVKIFMWHSLHGILPLKSIIIYNHHIGTAGGCPICNQGPEDINHLLFQCEAAKRIWESLGILELIMQTVHIGRSGSVVLEELLRRHDNTIEGISIGLKEIISVTCWYLWWIRRRRTHDEPVPPIHRCRMSILTIAANSKKESTTDGASVEMRWIRPKPRYIKLNVDA
jgi:hypothetical protein